MNEAVKNTTCFKEHKLADKNCKNKNCRQWMNCPLYNNCCIIAAEKGPRTLQEIGNLHGLTRMRICQIEKSAINKIKDKFSDINK